MIQVLCLQITSLMVEALARAYESANNMNYVYITWDNQVKASEFFNANGLVATLSEALKVWPHALDD